MRNTRSISRPMTSSSRQADRKRCCSRSCRVSTRATKSSFRNRPMPTTWRSPFRPERSSDPSYRPSNKVSRCPTWPSSETHQRTHARHPHLQSQQSDGLSLHAPREETASATWYSNTTCSLFGRGLPRIHLHGVALHLSLPSRRHRTACRVDRFGIETLLRMRHPHRRSHLKEPQGARRRDEILPSTPFAAALGANRG